MKNPLLSRQGIFPIVSGRLDSNQRPPTPEAGALTGLRYTPNNALIVLRAHKDNFKFRNGQKISEKYFAASRFADRPVLPPCRVRRHFAFRPRLRDSSPSSEKGSCGEVGLSSLSGRGNRIRTCDPLLPKRNPINSGKFYELFPISTNSCISTANIIIPFHFTFVYFKGFCIFVYKLCTSNRIYTQNELF